MQCAVAAVMTPNSSAGMPRMPNSLQELTTRSRSTNEH